MSEPSIDLPKFASDIEREIYTAAVKLLRGSGYSVGDLNAIWEGCNKGGSISEAAAKAIDQMKHYVEWRNKHATQGDNGAQPSSVMPEGKETCPPPGAAREVSSPEGKKKTTGASARYRSGGPSSRAAKLQAKAQAQPPPPSGQIPPPIQVDSYTDYQDGDENKEDEEVLPEFPIDTLPPRFRPLVDEVIRHHKVPAILPATCALVINSAAIGRGLVIESNVGNTYANIFGIIGAISGAGKSVSFDSFFEPLNELQKEAKVHFDKEIKPRAEAKLKMVQHEIQELAKQGRSSKNHSASEDAREQRLTELFQEQTELENRLKFHGRFWCSDFTSEALGVLLADNNEQISVLTDEGGLPLYNLLGRYTKGDMTDDILLCKAKTGNGHMVDRIGRDPVMLDNPLISLLLIAQPDIFKKAFRNERLLVGGFLCRCLTADSKMVLQYEEENVKLVDKVIKGAWNNHIRSIVGAYRNAEQPVRLSAARGIRKLSREYKNEIITEVRGTLYDVASFAIRWVERAWEIAINYHAGTYGAESHRHPLSEETFEKAIQVSKCFAQHQLAHLREPRIQALYNMNDRLVEIFKRHKNKPIKLRDLIRNHGLSKTEILKCVKSQSQTFGIKTIHNQRGAPPSLLIYLCTNPP
jgi:uncharacterized protein DUF3987